MANENNQFRNQLKKLKKGGGKDRDKGKGGGAGKGNGKGKDGKGSGRKDRGMSMPRALIGMASQIGGEAPCYDYNLPHGCTEHGVKRCDAGVHKCMWPGCEGDHSLVYCNHNLKKASQGVLDNRGR